MKKAFLEKVMIRRDTNFTHALKISQRFESVKNVTEYIQRLRKRKIRECMNEFKKFTKK